MKDKYMIKKLKLFDSCKDEKDKISFINRIYEEGLTDGLNETE